MCVVVPAAAAIALTAASAAVGYIGQQQQATAQNKYQNAVYQQQAQNAIANADYQNRQVDRQNQFIADNERNVRQALAADREALVAQERQQGIATALEIKQARIERLRAQGAIQSSERAGLTLDSLLADFDRQEANIVGIQQQNLAFSSAQRVRETDKLYATAESRINSARPYEAAPFQAPTAPMPVQGPSLLATGLGVASSAVGQLQSRSIYDPTLGRYRIDGMSRIPTSLPTPSPGQAWVNDVRTRFNTGGLN